MNTQHDVAEEGRHPSVVGSNDKIALAVACFLPMLSKELLQHGLPSARSKNGPNPSTSDAIVSMTGKHQ
jgi:hypothetical protein